MKKILLLILYANLFNCYHLNLKFPSDTDKYPIDKIGIIAFEYQNLINARTFFSKCNSSYFFSNNFPKISVDIMPKYFTIIKDGNFVVSNSLIIRDYETISFSESECFLNEKKFKNLKIQKDKILRFKILQENDSFFIDLDYINIDYYKNKNIQIFGILQKIYNFKNLRGLNN